jgi:hypothetical protein
MADFENLQLNAALIEQLYKNSLVLCTPSNEAAAIAATPVKASTSQENKTNQNLTVNATATTTATTNIAIKFLGSNKKQVLIIVADSTAIHVNDAALELLIKVLGACKLTLEDVALVNIHQQAVQLPQLQAHFQPKKMLIFGVPAVQLAIPFTIPRYRVQAHGSIEYLFANHLDSMLTADATAVIEKKNLWTSLKQLFAVA